MKTASLGLMMLICAFSFGQDSMRLPAFKPAAPATAAKKVPKFDWKFGSLFALETAALIWDESATMTCLNHYPGCKEANPIYGPHPSAARLYATSIALQAGYTIGSYELRRHGPRWMRMGWPAGMLFEAGAHIEGRAISGSKQDFINAARGKPYTFVK